MNPPRLSTSGAEFPSELALRDSELRYRRLFEAARDGILILDFATGRIRDANPFLEELLGFSHREMIGRTLSDLSPFKDIESNEAMLGRLQACGYARYDDLPLETRDGRQVAVEFVSNVYQAGQDMVIQCNVRDITERKRAAETLLLLNTCVAMLNDMVIITTADVIDQPGPQILFVNPAFERITGYAPAEALGRSPRFLQGAETDRQVLAEIRAALVRRQPIRRQVLNYRKDGRPYWVEMEIVPVLSSSGNCTHFAAVERDITAARAAEQQLRWRNAFFEALVNSSPDGLLVVDSDGRKLLQNRRMVELWEIPSEIAAESDDRRQLAWVTDQTKDPEKFNAKVAELNARPDAVSHDEIELRNGRVFDRDSAPVRGQDGKDYGRIWAFRDITERKRTEAQLLQAQRMESIGTLAGGIAHDLNNVLAPILMAIELLRPGCEQPQAKAILETLAVSAQRGADIVRQVLSFARGTGGERIEVSAEAIFADLGKILRGTFPKNIRVEFSQPPDAWPILGDPTQLEQVLLNLCVNARDAMPLGGSLSIRLANRMLDEAAARRLLLGQPGRYVTLAVSDSGAGIPAHLVDKIFEPFFTTKPVNQGTGLGLSMAMSIVKSHGGAIEVASDPGRGTTFSVWLPAVGGGAPPVPAGAAAGRASVGELPRGRGETVLVVDDEPGIRVVTSQALSAFGYEVRVAADGMEALAVYTQHGPEIALVLTDMTMPLMDGPALIQALRRINPSVRILAASGRGPADEFSAASQGRATRFLMKPFTAQELLVAVRTILDEP
jgi:PAS domain S-box-containing protein